MANLAIISVILGLNLVLFSSFVNGLLNFGLISGALRIYLVFICCFLPRYNLRNLSTGMKLLTVISLLPGVYAASTEQQKFPNIPFKLFSEFVEDNFSSKISLSTVLLVLLTLTNNTELLSLHARQKNPVYPGEYKTPVTAWIQALAQGIEDRLGKKSRQLFKKSEQEKRNKNSNNKILGPKLDSMAQLLDLYPYTPDGIFQGKLKPVSHKKISPVLFICPASVVCETTTCPPQSLRLVSFDRDALSVVLIQGTTAIKHVTVLTGICRQCRTIYCAD